MLLPTVPGGDRLLDLAELLLHAGINFVTELTAGGGEQSQQHDVLDKVIHDAAGWHLHRRHVEMCRQPGLDVEPFVAEGRNRSRRAAEQGLKDAGLALAKTFRMAREFIDPDGDFQPIGGRYSVLPMRTARQRHVFRFVRQFGQCREDSAELIEVDPVCFPELQQVPGLRDVLGRRSPMHIVPGVAVAESRQLPNQRH